MRARATREECEEPPAGGREKRKREFAVGRECAAQALLDAGAREVTVGVGRDRAPIWPSGFVGSITHSSSFTWAAVARSRDLRALGVDSEPLFDDDALVEALAIALDASERAYVQGERIRELGTLGFSAKESLFKCLYPRSGIFFDFADAALEWIKADGNDRGIFGLRLRRSLSAEFPNGMHLRGRYAIDRDHVHTAVELLP